jgi:hypothetical protein
MIPRVRILLELMVRFHDTRRIILMVLCIGCLSVVSGQRLTYSLFAEQRAYLIGEHVSLWLEVSADRLIVIGWPQTDGDTLPGGLQLLRVNHHDSTMAPDGIVHYRRQILVTAFDSGTYRIDSLPIQYLPSGSGQPAEYNHDPIQIRFILPALDKDASIRDIKGPFRAPITFWEIILRVLLLGALILLVVAVIRRMKNRRKEIPASASPETIRHIQDPCTIALDALKYLRQSTILTDHGPKVYHTQLSAILRSYIRDVFSVDAHELTTRQIMRALKPLTAITEAQYERLQLLLMTADLVKFARLVPDREESLALTDEAILFVTETAPVHLPEREEVIS